jgi:hypothetical protein
VPVQATGSSSSMRAYQRQQQQQQRWQQQTESKSREQGLQLEWRSHSARAFGTQHDRAPKEVLCNTHNLNFSICTQLPQVASHAKQVQREASKEGWLTAKDIKASTHNKFPP